jgi:FG-GAP-like repeat
MRPQQIRKERTMTTNSNKMHNHGYATTRRAAFSNLQPMFLLLLANLMLSGNASAQLPSHANFSDSAGWSASQYGSTIMTGDLNNDGFSDVCARAPSGIICALSNGTRFGNEFNATSSFSDAAHYDDAKYYSTLRLGDVNADHFPDICARASDGIYCALGKGDGTFYQPTLWSTQYSDANVGDLWYSSTMMLGDINKDGKADVCMRFPTGIYCSLSQGSSFAPVRLGVLGFEDSEGWGNPIYYSTLRLADVNGDKSLDVCARGYWGIVCSLGNGDGTFSAPTVWTYLFSNAQGWSPIQFAASITFGDVNGDGKADVCGTNGGGTYCAVSVGNSFIALSVYSGYLPRLSTQSDVNISPSYYGTYRLADVNRDGRAEMCARGSAGFVCEATTLEFYNAGIVN